MKKTYNLNGLIALVNILLVISLLGVSVWSFYTMFMKGDIIGLVCVYFLSFIGNRAMVTILRNSSNTFKKPNKLA